MSDRAQQTYDARVAQIAQCRAPDLPYLAWHRDADERTKRGERQQWCKTCERWQWADKRCGAFVRDEATEQAARRAAR